MNSTYIVSRERPVSGEPHCLILPPISKLVSSVPKPPPKASTKIHNLSTVAVVGKQVNSAARHTGDNTRRPQGLEAGRDRGRGSQALEGLEVEDQARDVRGRHGGARDAVGRRVGADPGRGDAGPGGEDVDAGSVVGVRGPPVRAGCGADGDGVGGGGGGDLISGLR